MNKKLLATSGLVSSLLLLSTTAAAYAATNTAPRSVAPTSSRQMRRMHDDGAFVTTIATKLGLNAEEIQAELTSGKTFKEVLTAHNITEEQVQKALGDRFANARKPVNNTMLSEMAAKLGLNATTVKTELDSGKSFKDILAENNITDEQIKTAFGDHGMGGRGQGMMHDSTKLSEMAAKLGLDAATVKTELDDGKSFKNILTEHNITDDQIKAVLGAEFPMGKGQRGEHGPRHMPAEVLGLQAKVLNITVEQLQSELTADQRITDVLKNHNLTIEEFDTKLKAAAQEALTAGNLTDEQISHYRRIIGRADRSSK